MEFEVVFHYENEWEQTSVELFVDAKKRTFDWNFLEDPESPDMQPFSGAATYVTVQMLGILSTSFAAEKQRRIDERKAQTDSRLASGKPRTDAWPVEVFKGGSPAFRKKRGIAYLDSELDASPLETAGVKRVIVIPDEDKFLADMKNVAIENRPTVLAAIREFNETGVGEFSMLRRSYVFALRVNTGRSGVRVLMREVASVDGERRFEVFDVDKREDVYKKHGLMS